MKTYVDPVIAARIKKAWNNLSDDQKRSIAPALGKANSVAVAVSQSRILPPGSQEVPRELLLTTSAMTGDADQVISALNAAPPSSPLVHPDGTIWGTGKYEQLDPGWLESAAEWLEHMVSGVHPFATTPAPNFIIPNDAQIALAGDWGTGDWRHNNNPAGSTDVRKKIGQFNPHITIHLGDVYYSGTSDQETANLVDIWPEGTQGSFTLNSNHEMYSGACPYFDIALTSAKFAAQGRCSFFALENDDWIIVGLDSAYYADQKDLYQTGSLGPSDGLQMTFLRAQAARGKKTIVLTHHNALTLDGNNQDNAGDPNNLWSQVTGVFGGAGPTLWYWGHAHAAAVYFPYGPQQISCRCCGHGGLPWGRCLELQNSPMRIWYESRSANDPDNPLRCLNGFAMLELNGPNVVETFYDEHGGIAWQSTST